MTHNNPDTSDVRFLIESVCDGTADNTQVRELELRLMNDTEACAFYADLLNLDAELRWIASSEQQGKEAIEKLVAAHTQPATTLIPVLEVRGGVWNGMACWVSSDWLVAYLIATVIFAIGAVIGSITYVTHPVQVAERLPVVTNNNRTVPQPQKEFVGRITGMVDCKWADSSTAAINGAHVPLGRKYVLSSGLMEITYDTGARVILQGPVTYENESNKGGFLSVGKLTGKVATEAARGLTIRTPTAIVTDLGTEFGVEVDKRGVTTSRVYRGLVRVDVLADSGEPEGTGQLLRENESARVERGSQRPIMVVPTSKSVDFVREIPIPKMPKMKTFDLVDVVAGGNGFSGRRDAGIDPTNGRPTDAPLPAIDVSGDGQYHRVEALPFVDSVFVPDTRAGGVQIDSAGHVFPWSTNAINRTVNHLWAGGIIPTDPPGSIPTELDGIDYASPGHGLLSLHANKGITFDLDAIRQANPDYRLLRFCAVAGNTETVSAKGEPALADLWVLVDGQVRYRRWQINNSHGAFSIVVPIDQNDRFLTLVATDGGNGVGYDWIMFGDPRLELVPVNSGTMQEEQPPKEIPLTEVQDN